MTGDPDLGGTLIEVNSEEEDNQVSDLANQIG